MVKIDGKEYTEEQLGNLMKDLSTAQTALKQKNELLKDKESLEAKVKEAEAIKLENEQLKADSMKKRFEDRTKMVSKFLASKDEDRRKSLADKIFNMDDDDFADFKEGKTDEEILTKDTLTSEKQTLESKEQELEKKKKDIIEEALKNMRKDEKAGDLLSPGAINNSASDNKNEVMLGDGKFPTIEKVKEIYGLGKNPMYTNKFTKFHEDRATSYLDTNYSRDNI